MNSKFEDIKNEYEQLTDFDKFVNAKIIKVIIELLEYLKENEDDIAQSFLNRLVNSIETIHPYDFIYNNTRVSDINGNVKKISSYNIIVFDYLSKMFKEGCVSNAGKQIFPKNIEKSNYYLYILIDKLKNTNQSSMEEYFKESEETYSKDGEKIQFDFLKKLKQFKKYRYINLKEKIKANKKYGICLRDVQLDSKSDYINLYAIIEDLKNGEYSHLRSVLSNLQKFSLHVEKIKMQIGMKENIDSNILYLLMNVFEKGIKNNIGNYIIVPNKELETKFSSEYSRIIEKSTVDSDTDEKCEKTCKNEVNIKKNKRKNKKTYVCSDLHGNYDIYSNIINQLNKNDILYVLGDVIDRGPDGIKILQDIIKRSKTGQIEFIIGNHEYMMLNALFYEDKIEEMNWVSQNGGDVTKREFDNLSEEEKNDIKDFLEESLVFKKIKINNQSMCLVHAKFIEMDKNMESCKVKDLLSIDKEKFLEAIWERPTIGVAENKSVKQSFVYIVGHTPTNSSKVEVLGNYIMIDAGAAYDGNCALLRLNDGEIIYFKESDKLFQKEIDEKSL